MIRTIKQLIADYPDRYELVTPERLSFDEYGSVLSSVNVVVDQLYGAGLGMNALSSMARGRIVLTSFDPTFSAGDLDYRTAPAHDISKGQDALRASLELIESWSPEQLEDAAVRSRLYVEQHCKPTVVAQRLCDAWLASREREHRKCSTLPGSVR
jgi:hypothetical protein